MSEFLDIMVTLPVWSILAILVVGVVLGEVACIMAVLVFRSIRQGRAEKTKTVSSNQAPPDFMDGAFGPVRRVEPAKATPAVERPASSPVSSPPPAPVAPTPSRDNPATSTISINRSSVATRQVVSNPAIRPVTRVTPPVSAPPLERPVAPVPPPAPRPAVIQPQPPQLEPYPEGEDDEEPDDIQESEEQVFYDSPKEAASLYVASPKQTIPRQVATRPVSPKAKNVKMYSVKEAAAMMGMGYEATRRNVSLGNIKATKSDKGYWEISSETIREEILKRVTRK